MNKCFMLVCVYLSLFPVIKDFNMHTLQFKDSAIIEFLTSFLEFIQNISEEELFYSKEYADCLNALLTSITSENIGLFKDTLNYCGKDISDQGHEYECLKNDTTTFFLFHYKLNLSALYYNNTYITDNIAMQFANSSDLYTGFCMYKDCMKFLIQMYFNKTVNEKFYEFFYEYAYIVETYFTVQKEFEYLTVNNTLSLADDFLSGTFLAITIISLSLLLIMIIISVFRVLYLMFAEDTIDVSLNTEEEDIVPKDQNSSISDISRNVSQEMSKEQIQIDVNGISKTLSLKTIYDGLNTIDFFSNFTYLFGLKNRYYNDEGLEVLSLIRGMIMFFVVYFHICYSLLVIPPQDPYNLSFYKSSMFFLVKLSSLSTVCWIILDATTVSYNLMSNIKKNTNSNNHYVPFGLFCRFALDAISKLLIVLFLFLYINILGKYSSNHFNMGVLFKHFYNNIIEKECINCFLSSFTQDKSNTTWFYFHIYQNEFYCFLIALIVIFISFKLRSKIFDSIILAILLINCGLTYIEISSDQSGKSNTFLFVLGQNYTYKNVYMFINIYLMGIFVGICYFYYNDMISNNPLGSMDGEVPFSFCYWIVNKCDRLKYAYKCLSLALLISLLLLLSFSFKIIQCFKANITDYITLYEVILDKYEKTVFGFIFCWILLFVLIHPKDTSFKHIIHSNIFLPLSRITTVFYCICRFVVYYSITTYNFRINLDYYDFFFAAIALFTLNILISIVITVLYEMPVRILIKYLKKKCKGYDDSSSYSSKLK